MIYFVRETGLFRSRVKIGFTDTIKGRISRLRGGSPSSLKLLMILPGDTHIEAAYHEKFSKYKLHGEWFKFGLQLRLFVWMNQFKPFVLDKESSDISKDSPESEISALDLDIAEPEPNLPTTNEIRIIEAVKQVKMDHGRLILILDRSQRAP